MIYLVYATHINANGTLIPVNGHRSRCEAISQWLDQYTMLSLNAAPPQYVEGDMVIIDPGDRDYAKFLDPRAFSILISDQHGRIVTQSPVNYIWYVSGGAWDTLNPNISQMIFTVGADLRKHSWTGGESVLFLPGSNAADFWKVARRYKDYCQTTNITVNIPDVIDHAQLMSYAISSRCVITASGVTAKEMIYQGVPCIMIQTASNQAANYLYFVIQRVLALGEETPPEVLSNTTLLAYLSHIIKKERILSTDHMVDIIKRVYEIHR